MKLITMAMIVGAFSVATAFTPTNQALKADNSTKVSIDDKDGAERHRSMSRESRIMRRVLTKALNVTNRKLQGKNLGRSKTSSRPSSKDLAPTSELDQYFLAAGAFGGSLSATGNNLHFATSMTNSQVLPSYGTVVSLRLRLPRYEVDPDPKTDKYLWEESSSEVEGATWLRSRISKNRWEFSSEAIDHNINTVLATLARHAKHLKSYRPNNYYAVTLELRSKDGSGRPSPLGNRVSIQVLVSECMAADRRDNAAKTLRHAKGTRISRF
ncbi:MAG: hypothetical protein V3W41_19325 [Planctomycetota bacterium]